MALFGDVGKFFGLGSAGEVAADVTGFLGGGTQAQQLVGGAAQAVSEAVSGIGESKPDVATAPRQAGVDSAATVLPVSQTGMLMPQQPGTPGFGQTNMAGVAAFGHRRRAIIV
jgi:hypothetical protein